MIVVHHLETSRSRRVLWLLEELGQDYEVVLYERDPVTRLAPPALGAIHPLGKSPVVVDDGIAIAESGAIFEHLVRRHGAGKLAPPAVSPERLRYDYWLHYAEGSAMTPLLMGLTLQMSGVSMGPGFDFAAAQVALHFDYIESELGNNEWLVGSDFTAADILMSFPLELVEAQGGTAERPNIARFLNSARERPAYQRAARRGGRYNLAF